MEKDLAREARSDAITLLIVLIEVVLVIVGIQHIVAPTIRSTTDFTVVNAQAVTDGNFDTPVPVIDPNAQIDASGVNLTPDDLALRVLETAPAPRTTVQSPLRWSDNADWKLDYCNIERLSAEEIQRRRAEFDAGKAQARQILEATGLKRVGDNRCG